MTHVLLWKEYRTQRMAWIALALVAAAALLGLPLVLAPAGLQGRPDVRTSLLFLAGALAWAYGMICGAMLLAGEREMGTLTFLDTQPAFRRHLWTAKLLSGVLLVTAQIAVLAALAAAARLYYDWSEVGWTLYGMVCAGLYGLAWGLLFSAFGRGVLNMILLALAAQLVAGFVTAYLNFLLTTIFIGNGGMGPTEANAFENGFIGLFSMLTVVAALAVSAVRFTRLDWNRLAPPTIEAAAASDAARRGRVAWSRLFWLIGRQSQGFAVGMAVFALLLGLVVLADGLILWPATTLLVGVLCGATAFADEQQGPFRFLGDQRLPLGRLWLVKVGLRFAVAAGASLLILAPSLLVALARMPDLAQDYAGREYPFSALLFGSSLVGTVCPTGLFLTIWLVSGFGAGCLCGLLFRHGLAAGIFALCLGSLLTAVWVPSLLTGGLHAWQVYGAPILLIMSTLALLRPWAAGRIASWTTAVRLTPFVVLAVIWIAAGLGCRVWEIPAAAPKYDLAAFEAGLPKPDQDPAGDLVRGACLRFNDLTRKEAEQAGPAAVVMGMAPGQLGPAVLAPDRPPNMNRASEAVFNGWPAGDAELAAWLDKVFQGDWLPSLREAADLPPGMVEDLHHFTYDSSARTTEPARNIGVVLAARGLQRQAAGDDAAYVEDLRIGLALARALRHRAPRHVVEAGFAVEGDLLTGLIRWMERLNGRPDLLRQALGLLSDYQDATAADDTDQNLVDYFIAHKSLEDPNPWVKDYLAGAADPRDRADVAIRREAQWVALAIVLNPWEHERQERLLRLDFEESDPLRRLRLLDEQGPLRMLSPYRYSNPFESNLKCLERIMPVALALRLYQAENGKPAQTLDELVPKYLPAIPLDPYDGMPVRYRLSAGEEMEVPGESAPLGAPAAPGPRTRTIPLGQGVLWCTGPDGKDDGGRRQLGSSGGPRAPGMDEIFLVPLPPKGE